MVPTENKNSATLNLFTENIRKMEPKNCNCNFRLLYIQNIGNVSVIWIQFQLFWKTDPIKHRFLARFHAFCFSCDSCRNQASFYGSWRKERPGKQSGSLTYGIEFCFRVGLNSQCKKYSSSCKKFCKFCFETPKFIIFMN